MPTGIAVLDIAAIAEWDELFVTVVSKFLAPLMVVVLDYSSDAFVVAGFHASIAEADGLEW